MFSYVLKGWDQMNHGLKSTQTDSSKNEWPCQAVA